MHIVRIRRLANLFYAASVIQKKASLEGDMAKRVMLSIIPNFISPGVNFQTGGLPDYNALAAAVKGAEDIIRYGAKSCVDELEHYGAVYYNNSMVTKPGSKEKRIKCRELYNQALSKIKNEQYLGALKICALAFDDDEAWDDLFGGKAWAKIAKSLLSICTNYIRLRATNAATPEEKQGEDFYPKQKQLMQQILVDMNVFDGLAHNTGSIYDKMIEHELVEKDPEFKQRWFAEPKNENTYPGQDEIKRMYRIMDAKELRNPVDVYNQIEQSLQNTPDQYLFRDWVTKLRNNPDYRNQAGRQAEVEKELEIIRERKYMISNTEKILTAIDKLFPIVNNQISMESLKREDRIGYYAEGIEDPIDEIRGVIKFMPSSKDKKSFAEKQKASDKLYEIQEKQFVLSQRFHEYYEPLTEADRQLVIAFAHSVRDFVEMVRQF